MKRKKKAPARGKNAFQQMGIELLNNLPGGQGWQVEKNVPVKVSRGLHVAVKYPEVFKAMEAMQVGDSIFYDLSQKKAVHGCRLALEKSALGLVYRFVTTRVDAGSMRTWRIEVNGNGKPNKLAGNRKRLRK